MFRDAAEGCNVVSTAAPAKVLGVGAAVFSCATCGKLCDVLRMSVLDDGAIEVDTAVFDCTTVVVTAAVVTGQAGCQQYLSGSRKRRLPSGHTLTSFEQLSLVASAGAVAGLRVEVTLTIGQDGNMQPLSSSRERDVPSGQLLMSFVQPNAGVGGRCCEGVVVTRNVALDVATAGKTAQDRNIQ